MPTSPIVLAFETSQAWCAACLLGASDTPIVRVDHMARGQAEHLMILLEEVLAEAGLGWHDIDLIGVGIGPGNFTGIRISVAAARGLAMSLDIAAIGVSAFQAATRQSTPYWVAVDAPRDQAYIQHFDTQKSVPELVSTTRLAELDAPLVRASDTSPEQRIENIATYARALVGQPKMAPTPLYIRAPDAAPPRHAAPVILP